MDEIREIKRIKVPNVQYNVYEYIYKRGFWSANYYIRSKAGERGCYTKEYKVVNDEWTIVKKEIELINWFFDVGIRKKDFEIMKSSDFKEQEKAYYGCKITEIDYFSFRPNWEIVKKHWALELWKWYNNNYHLEGIGTFRTMGENGDVIILNGRVRSVLPGVYHWEWPQKYGLIH